MPIFKDALTKNSDSDRNNSESNWETAQNYQSNSNINPQATAQGKSMTKKLVSPKRVDVLVKKKYLEFLMGHKAVCEDYVLINSEEVKDYRRTDYAQLNGGMSSSMMSTSRVKDWMYVYDKKSPIQPIIFIDVNQFNDLDKYFSEFKIRKHEQKDKKSNDVNVFVEFGYYPKNCVSDSAQLEKLYQQDFLTPTGRSYIGHVNKKGKLVRNPEFEYDGERYVRVIIDDIEDIDTTTFMLSTKACATLKKGEVYWVKVEPILWEVQNWDFLPQSINPNGRGTADSVMLMTVSGILGGIPFYISKDPLTNILWQSSLVRAVLNGYDIQWQLANGNGNPGLAAWNNYDFHNEGFLDEAFADFNEPARQQSGGKRTMQTRLEKLNPDTTPENARRVMTDTEIIKSWIDAGESVLLRGPSGIGKTERIKTLYPDLLYIKLTNNMFPEKVVGSLNLQTGQAIPPDFAKEAILACANEEERQAIKENIQNIFELADIIYERSKNADKKTVILLDELLNVKPAVQSLVYSLVLNKMVEMGHGLKLPSNVVIVATGNQKKYSSIAEDLVEPLEKRFDHIYDMEPKVDEWLVDYAIPNKLHPAVIGYIMTKQRSSDKEDISYFYESPEVGERYVDKNGCRGRTNDPRGWAAMSRMLYNFEDDLVAGKFIGKNVEHLLRTTIESKLRTGWSSEFYTFYNRPQLSVQSVVEHKYTEDDLPTDINDKFFVMAGLLTANETEFRECREFIKKYCSPEYLIIYDTYWAGNDDARIELAAELARLDAFDTKERSR